MAKHGNSIGTVITAAYIRECMERRFADLYDNGQYNDQYFGGFNFLESVLADSFTDERIAPAVTKGQAGTDCSGSEILESIFKFAETLTETPATQPQVFLTAAKEAACRG
jgi:hypothetical protein